MFIILQLKKTHSVLKNTIICSSPLFSSSFLYFPCSSFVCLSYRSLNVRSLQYMAPKLFFNKILKDLFFKLLELTTLSFVPIRGLKIASNLWLLQGYHFVPSQDSFNNEKECYYLLRQDNLYILEFTWAGWDGWSCNSK